MELKNKKILITGADETIVWFMKNLAKYKVNIYNVLSKNKDFLVIVENEKQIGANNGI
jgi:hypothetical protein